MWRHHSKILLWLSLGELELLLDVLSLPSFFSACSSTQAVNCLLSVLVIHSCCSTPQLSRIGFLKMSLHGDIHSPLLSRNGCSQGQRELKNELTNVGQDIFFFLLWLRELLLCVNWRLRQPPFFKMHTKDDNLFPEYHWLAEPLNKLLESVGLGEDLVTRSCMRATIILYAHKIRSCFQGLAINELKSNDLSN